MRNCASASFPRVFTVFGSQWRRTSGRRAGSFLQGGTVDLVVQLEQKQLMPRAWRHAAAEPLIQLPLGLVIVLDLAGVRPPTLQITPTQAPGPDRSVVDEDIPGGIHHLDIAVDDVDEPQIRLSRAREDELLGPAGPRPSGYQVEGRVCGGDDDVEGEPSWLISQVHRSTAIVSSGFGTHQPRGLVGRVGSTCSLPSSVSC